MYRQSGNGLFRRIGPWDDALTKSQVDGFLNSGNALGSRSYLTGQPDFTKDKQAFGQSFVANAALYGQHDRKIGCWLRNFKTPDSVHENILVRRLQGAMLV